ncbi:peptidoglycan-recognition protein 1-like [Macrosteles quadrilineatus]|uniref:peptidoglycan-recognition protein 1-like n=1 Tax=Macrosteles quadrilineatus TaxID=74068 RepID=UPI0023E25827|nr:peptidoglycan-recognition protein 1-like [Macrosteles quadrilineatus]
MYRTLSTQPEKASVVSRAEWGAVEHTGNKPIRHPIIYVFLTINSHAPRCANKEECSRILRDMQDRDMKDGCTDIKYNFLIGDDGTIYEGRGWNFRPHHLDQFPSMDGQMLDFACIGNFRKELRPDAMYDAQWKLLNLGIELKYLAKHAHYW